MIGNYYKVVINGIPASKLPGSWVCFVFKTKTYTTLWQCITMEGAAKT